MARNKPPVPTIPTSAGVLAPLLGAMKDNIDMITGLRGGAVQPLPASATPAEVIAKLNELIARVNS